MRYLYLFLLLGFGLIVTTSALGQSPASPLPTGARYVAMGSSFAAGPGIPDQLESCGRSSNNYPHLVAVALGLALVDVSCSGATTDHILLTPQGNAPLQIAAVTPDTALVTITIGGNDIEYTRSTFACAGAAAEDACAANLDQANISTLVSQLPDKLGATVDAIRAIAPQAKVVFVTYPRVFPEDYAACADVAMSNADAAFMSRLGQQLEDTFVRVAAAKQTLIADAYVLGEGHGPCAVPSERWINANTVALDGARYHPTAAGHRVMARLVFAAVSQ